MSSWARMGAASAAEIARLFELSAEAIPLLEGQPSASAFLEALTRQGCYSDAVRLLAYALPKREALWWGCRCIRATGTTSHEQVAALEAAEAYVAVPTDSHRRNAMQAAEAADFGTPAGCVAAAAFFSAGSLAPPDLPPVPPADHLTPLSVAAAVILCALGNKPEKGPDKFQAFLTLGRAVAEGKERWKE